MDIGFRLSWLHLQLTNIKHLNLKNLGESFDWEEEKSRPSSKEEEQDDVRVIAIRNNRFEVEPQ